MTCAKKAGTLFLVAVLVTTVLFVADFMPQPYRLAWATSQAFTLNPTSGPAGTTVSASGSNYAGTICMFSSSPVGLIASPTCSITSGTLSGGFTVAHDAPTGPYAVIVATNVADEMGSATFTVTSTTLAPATFTLNPTSGPEGTTVIASGSNYLGSMCSLSSSPSGLLSSSSCSISGGTLTGGFTVAPGAAIGSYAVTVTTDVSGEVSSATFTVTTTTTTVSVSTPEFPEVPALLLLVFSLVFILLRRASRRIPIREEPT